MRTKSRKLVCLLGLLLLCSTAVLAASATANISPDGWNEGCKFNDDNGMLIDTRGADATWANSVGTLMAYDPYFTKSASGGPVDQKDFEGVIVGAESPYWVVVLSATAKVWVRGERGGNFTRPISCLSKSELTAWGMIWGFDGRELYICDAVTPGHYDIAVLVGLATEQVTDGGTAYGMGVYPTPQVKTDWSLLSFNVTIPGDQAEFVYRSCVYTYMEIDFTTTGYEMVGVEVDQENEGPWSGVAVAFDGGLLVDFFVLD